MRNKKVEVFNIKININNFFNAFFIVNNEV